MSRRRDGKDRFRVLALGIAASGVALLGAKGCDSGGIGVQEYGTIQGNAIDGRGKPLVGAVVSVGSLATVRSNDDGSFVLPHVPSGEQEVDASLGGYKTGTVTVIVRKDREVSAGNIVLEQLTANP